MRFLTLEQASFETSRQNQFRQTSRRMQVRQHCTLKREDNTRIQKVKGPWQQLLTKVRQ